MDEIKLKQLIRDSKVIDVDFGYFNGVMHRMVLETNDKNLLLVEPEPVKYEGCVVGYCFRVTDVKTHERVA